jgi:hypothetical protein
MRVNRSPLSLAYNLDILSQLPDGLFAAKPCGALTDYRAAVCHPYPQPFVLPFSAIFATVIQQLGMASSAGGRLSRKTVIKGCPKSHHETRELSTDSS